MTLSAYHQRYVNLPQKNIDHGLGCKEYQLTQVFGSLNLDFNKDMLKVAVLGCADKRFVKGHKILFEKILQKKVELTTFDITVEHLQGEENIIKHDCTKPFPGVPFDIVFSHILIKFLPPEAQWQMLKNSYEALAPNGVAVHFMDVGGKSTPTSMLPEGFNLIPLEEFKTKFDEEKISFKELIVEKEKGIGLNLECLVLTKKD